MTHSSSNPVPPFSPQTQAELDLLQTVLEDSTYPWNPYDPAAAAYFSDLETAWGEEDLSIAALAPQWQALLTLADQVWAARSGTAQALLTILTQRFESRMPKELLRGLAENARAVVSSGRPIVEQLVSCVQDVLSGWESEDLEVLARPLALAMRDGRGEILDVTLRSVRSTEWAELSELEQARLSLAIARYALDCAEEMAD
jgi:hypothetical protein